MPRVFLADAQPEECLALRLLLLDLKMEIVGESANWAITLSRAPDSQMDMLVVDFALLPMDPKRALAELRLACHKAIVIVLISNLNTRQQSALSVGADTFINKGEASEQVAEHLQDAAGLVPP